MRCLQPAWPTHWERRTPKVVAVKWARLELGPYSTSTLSFQTARLQSPNHPSGEPRNADNATPAPSKISDPLHLLGDPRPSSMAERKFVTQILRPCLVCLFVPFGVFMELTQSRLWRNHSILFAHTPAKEPKTAQNVRTTLIPQLHPKILLDANHKVFVGHARADKIGRSFYLVHVFPFGP